MKSVHSIGLVDYTLLVHVDSACILHVVLNRKEARTLHVFHNLCRDRNPWK
jgi:hypothetical protein